MLMVNGHVLQESETGFYHYDEISRTVVVRPGREALDAIADGGTEVLAMADMRFMVATMSNFYRRYERFLTLPESDPVPIAPRSLEGSKPSDQQRRAVNIVLSSRMSYVWGIPGTGKT